MRSFLSILIILAGGFYIVFYGFPRLITDFVYFSKEPSKNGFKIIYGLIQLSIAGYFVITEFMRLRTKKSK